MYRLIPTLCAGIILLIPLMASAQFGLVPCDGPECQACHAVELGQNVLNFLVYIAAFIGVMLFAYAGFLMVTAAGNMSQVEKAKGIFTNVLIGIIIVLVGWLVVDTVMKWAFEERDGEAGSELYEATESNFGPWNRINCVQQPILFSREGDAPGALLVSEDGTVREGAYSQSQAAAILEEAGIAVVSSGRCTDPRNSKCTSLSGIREDTVKQVLAVKEACATCTIVITGGTETGHAGGETSHGAGYKIDISDNNTTLNRFFEQTLTRAGSRSGAHGGARYVDRCGNEYVRESTHWDISVTKGSCALR